MPKVVLATTSRFRVALFQRLGIPFVAVPHACDERALEPRTSDPVVVAAFLARAKAESLADSLPGEVIVGSDQVVEIDGTILGIPGSKERAREQLARLSGREHRIVTAVAVRTPTGQVLEHVDVHVMTMRSLTARAIEAYVDADDPHDCAGAYKLEERGIMLFSSIRGDDHTAIVGLPLMATVTLLERAGVPVLEPA
ncbi:MAG: septum formation protein Maf [Myxococcales bacterium]|nr:septum formation protein Maf [Myxococcales bacterium]